MAKPVTGALSGRHMLILGPGYAAREVARRFVAGGGEVSATLRATEHGPDPEKAHILEAIGATPVVLDVEGRLLSPSLDGVTDLLISVPPLRESCPGYEAIATIPTPDLRWIGYYSSTAVYGDCGGAWIDETRIPDPQTRDAKARLVAETQWAEFAKERASALDILRIAGIYGPEGRNLIARLSSGTAKAILKPGQVFNRIHRDDIAGATVASLLSPGRRVINLSDGAPCAASDVIFGVAEMLGLSRPESCPIEEAGLPPVALGFYAENRRLTNDRLCALPGFELTYPDWRSGYAALLKDDIVTFH